MISVKALLQQPEQCIVEHWGSIEACPHAENIRSDIEQLRDTKKTQKSLNKNKSEIARQFKTADDEQKQQLKADMAGVSSELKRVDSLRSDIETRLLDYFSDSQESASRDADDITAALCLETHYPQADAVAARCRPATEQDRAAWQGFVEQHPGGHFNHRWDIAELSATFFKHRFRPWIAEDDQQQVVGVLPIIHMNSPLFGNFASSMPWFNYGGPLAQSEAVAEALIATAAEALLADGAGHLECRETCKRERWQRREDKVSMLLPLTTDSEALWQSFPSKLRSQIRRAQREPHSIRSGGIELLDDWYRVFAHNMRDLGTPVYSKHWFQALLSAFPQQASLHVVYLDQRPVSAGFLINDKQVMQIPWASTLKQFNHLSVNMLLYWHLLQYSIEQGCHWFDFGRSTRDAGTYRFKKQWGAQELPHFWHYVLPEGETLPAINPDNPKYRFMIAVWQRLPVWLSRIIGPPVIRGIP